MRQSPAGSGDRGIVRSDDARLSFAVIKTRAVSEATVRVNLAGFNDAFIQEINKDNVVVNYEGATQVLALNKPDYFKGAWIAARLQNRRKMLAQKVCILMIIWC